MHKHGILALTLALIHQTGCVTIGPLHQHAEMQRETWGTGGCVAGGGIDAAQVPQREPGISHQLTQRRRDVSHLKSAFSTLVRRADEDASYNDLDSAPRPSSPSRSPGRADPTAVATQLNTLQLSAAPNPNSPGLTTKAARQQLRLSKMQEKAHPGAVMVHTITPNPQYSSGVLNKATGLRSYYRKISGGTYTKVGFYNLLRSLYAPNRNHSVAMTRPSKEKYNGMDPARFEVWRTLRQDEDPSWYRITPKTEIPFFVGEVQPWTNGQFRQHLIKQARYFQHHEPGKTNSGYGESNNSMRFMCTMERCELPPGLHA